MVKTKTGGSKKKTSAQRNKIERKKREHKRDLKKAAKALKKNGMAPKRSKKTREAAKMALRISNANPDKEKILESVLKAREVMKVIRADRRAQRREEENETEVPQLPKENNDRSMLYVPTRFAYNMMYQFRKVVDDLVFPTEGDSPVGLPAAMFLVTADARCAVHSMPWTLLDAIVDRAAERSELADATEVLVLIALTKVDAVSAQAIGTQVSLLDNAIAKRYASTKGLRFTVCPVSIFFDNTVKHVMKIIRFNLARLQEGIDKDEAKKATNMCGKMACFVLGLPNTGRRSLCRAMHTLGSETTVAMIPIRAAKVQQVKGDDDTETIRFAIPNAKTITLLSLAEDEHMRSLSASNVIAGDVLFQSPSFVEKMTTPEACATLIVEGVTNKVLLAQAFCQTAIADDTKGIMNFLKGIGHTVRRDKGFYVSSLLVDSASTAGQLASSSLLAGSGFTSQKTTLLDATYSNATPSKFVHLSTVLHEGKGGKKSFAIKRSDGRNVLRIGARTFVREFIQSKHVPWAVLRPGPGDDEITAADAATIRVFRLFDFMASAKESDVPVSFEAFAMALSNLIAPNVILLPRSVVEVSSSIVRPVLHDVEGEFAETDDIEDDDDEDDDEEDDEEDDDNEEADEEDDEEDDGEDE